ncbi:MAG: hypothetical protein NZ990_12570, partial [Myxococcota bacterium]|nr:hypothetical protein [Myxococcota bacterium]
MRRNIHLAPVVAWSTLAMLSCLVACGGEESAPPKPKASAPAPAPTPTKAAGPTTPADLPQALVLGLAQFPALGKGPPKPLPDRK